MPGGKAEDESGLPPGEDDNADGWQKGRKDIVFFDWKQYQHSMIAAATPPSVPSV